MMAFLFVPLFFCAVPVEVAFSSGTEPKEDGIGTGEGDSNSGGITGRLVLESVPLGLFRLGIAPGDGITGRSGSKPLDEGLGSTEPGRGTVGRGEGFVERGSFPSPSRGGDNSGKGYRGDGNSSSGNGVFGKSRGGVGRVERGFSASDEGGLSVNAEGSLINAKATPTTTTTNAANLAS
jgi:hypothetical protein